MSDVPTRMPGWFKAFLAVSALVVVLFIVLLLVTGGHGPARHGI